jgi:large conductance mechanosensitive channel
MLNEFKKFILKGNVVDLSTGVIIGAAFGNIVKAFTDGIVTPLLRLVGGKPDVTLGIPIGTFTDDAGKTTANMLDIGLIINASISFLITAAVIFFVIIKPFNYLLAMMKAQEAAAPPPPPSNQEVLLAEIRDLLKK